MMKKGWVFRRGDLYTANLNPYRGSEQGGTRPVLVLQNNDGNYYCPTLIIAPLTAKLKKVSLPTHYYVSAAKGLSAPSIVELEQIKTIDKSRIESYLGRFDAEQMAGVDEALQRSLGLYIPECVDAP